MSEPEAYVQKEVEEKAPETKIDQEPKPEAENQAAESQENNNPTGKYSSNSQSQTTLWRKQKN